MMVAENLRVSELPSLEDTLRSNYCRGGGVSVVSRLQRTDTNESRPSPVKDESRLPPPRTTRRTSTRLGVVGYFRVRRNCVTRILVAVMVAAAAAGCSSFGSLLPIHAALALCLTHGGIASCGCAARGTKRPSLRMVPPSPTEACSVEVAGIDAAHPLLRLMIYLNRGAAARSRGSRRGGARPHRVVHHHHRVATNSRRSKLVDVGWGTTPSSSLGVNRPRSARPYDRRQHRTVCRLTLTPLHLVRSRYGPDPTPGTATGGGPCRP
jgi:hypothetical protein